MAPREGLPAARPSLNGPERDPAPLPQAFLERLGRILPAGRTEGVLASFAEEPPAVFFANTLRRTAEELLAELQAEGFEPTPLPWRPGAFRLPAGERAALADGAASREGRLFVLNASSLVPPLALAPRPGEAVLDLCAAPGGKTLQLACALEGRGALSAVDSVRARFFRLKRNLRAQGADFVRTFLKDGAGVWRSCPEAFDRVLVDAPCTSEARFRAADPDTWAYWSERKIAEMARKQKRLLFSGIQCLAPGGVLVYSTCTFAPEENEAVVGALLESTGDALELEPLELPFENAAGGLPEWNGRPFHPALAGAARILPADGMEGFFVCRLRKLRSTRRTDRAARGARTPRRRRIPARGRTTGPPRSRS